MCGIVGVWSASSSGLPDDSTFAAMRDALRHRGPDDEGAFTGPGVRLGHRRLSIVDVAGGHQPLGNEDGTIRIVFNGEIYNFPALKQQLEAAGHRFATRSDTESIVHLYEEKGNGAVSELGGMFAFAIWDEQKRRLLLARDRAGIKPLYYAVEQRKVAFASEIRPLLSLPWVSRAVDPGSLERYLERGYVPAPRTMFRDVQKLPAGHLLVVERGQVTIRQYATPPVRSYADLSEEELRERLVAELDRSVREHLLADVPIGAFLSGGLDSSLVVALMRRHHTGTLKTFSVGVRGADGFDESSHARAVAEHFATEHYEIPFSVDAIPRLVPEVARYLDEPVSDPAVLPTYVLAGIAATHVKVVLTGEGADETWGGYEDAFRKAVIVARYRRVPQWIRAGGMDAALRTIPAGDRLVTASRQPGYVAQLVHFDAAARRAVLDSGIPIVSPDVNGRVAIDSADPIGSVTRDSIPTHLAERLLLKVDRTTMAHSLEARVPFLDNDLVRFALGVPGQYKIRGRVTKRLLREAADGLLPEATRRRRKQGFNLPCGEWLRTSLAPLVRELFSTPALPELLHGSFVDELWKEHQTGRRDHATKLWSLVTLQLWARGFLQG